MGIKQGKGSNPVRCDKDPKYPDDVHIEDFDGGVPLNHLTREAVTLAKAGRSCGTMCSNQFGDRARIAALAFYD